MSLHLVPGGADPGRGLASSSGRLVHGIRTNRSSPPSAANTGPGATITPCRSAAVATAVPSASGSRHHSASPPVGTPEVPRRDVLAERGHQRVALLAQPRAVAAQDLRRALEQSQEHELLEDGCAQVEAHPGPGQRVDEVVRRPHPAEPQAAPEALARAADGDRAGGVRRERPRHRLTLQRERLVRLVDHGDRARGPHVGGVRLPLLVAHQQPGRVLEVGDQVGQPRRGLPQRGAHGVEVPAVRVDGRGREPGAAGAQRLGGVGVDRGLDQHPVAGAGERLGDDRGRRQGARGHHDLARGRSAARARRRCGRSRPGARAARPGSSRARRGRRAAARPPRRTPRRAPAARSAPRS